MRLTFANVTGAGSVAYTAINPTSVAGSYSLPSGYTIQGTQPAYDVTTTATATGDIDVCIAGINEYSPTAFANLKILHGEGSAWVDRTISSDFSLRQICARVTTLSPFVIAQGPSVPTTRARRMISTATRKPTSAFSDRRTAVGGISVRPTALFAFIRSARRPTSSRPAITPATAKPTSPFSVLRPANGLFSESKIIRSSHSRSAQRAIFPRRPITTATAKPMPPFFVLRRQPGISPNSNGSDTSIVNFGSAEDKPVPADYDGDGKADIAIFRPSDG